MQRSIRVYSDTWLQSCEQGTRPVSQAVRQSGCQSVSVQLSVRQYRIVPWLQPYDSGIPFVCQSGCLSGSQSVTVQLSVRQYRSIPWLQPYESGIPFVCQAVSQAVRQSGRQSIPASDDTQAHSCFLLEREHMRTVNQPCLPLNQSVCLSVCQSKCKCI